MNGFPALGTALVTPLTLTVPQARVVTCVGLTETCAASACPLAPALVPGKNIASEARPATERRPAGRRKRLRDRLLEWCAHASHAYLRRNRQL